MPGYPGNTGANTVADGRAVSSDTGGYGTAGGIYTHGRIVAVAQHGPHISDAPAADRASAYFLATHRRAAPGNVAAGAAAH